MVGARLETGRRTFWDVVFPGASEEEYELAADEKHTDQTTNVAVSVSVRADIVLSRHRCIGPQALIWSSICSVPSRSAWLEQAMLHDGSRCTWESMRAFARHSRRGHVDHAHHVPAEPA